MKANQTALLIVMFLCAILSLCTPSFSQPQEEKMRVAVVEFDEEEDLGISRW